MEKLSNIKTPSTGLLIMILGTAIVLLWIGVFKFTLTEAKGIKSLVENHPLMGWSYEIWSIRTVSNIIGIIEIITGLMLLIGIKIKNSLKWAGLLMILTFGFTISFLFTTPGVWKTVDGVPVTDFFILKDLVFLGFGVALWKDSIK
ncbi:DUF417 family protein [Chryseobacterium sp. M5]|uniref:DUF417 family protein n=1 Tax=Bacteroidota TaxID=976 RepID=UPI0008A2173B|nr:DUF417 family protein [Sphingobacterium sp. HMSC13C05]MBX2977308.1 DUF417 family protein [Ignavibacteriaceae bacterium]OFV19235.1 hypothetical protein HMPREF3127_05270 [Sphingobacterium sp. HMSC13C05]SJN19951.1 Arginine/ornithine antiporter ArcD [Sphingobacterium faecium PCAi_F2.5]